MQGKVVPLLQPANAGKLEGEVTVSDLQQAMREVFERRVDINRAGHLGDITPLDRELSKAMAADYPDETGPVTVPCQQK